jgi:hypothetical protein
VVGRINVGTAANARTLAAPGLDVAPMIGIRRRICRLITAEPVRHLQRLAVYLNVTTTAIDTAPLQEELFAIPGGWKTKATGYDKARQD